MPRFGELLHSDSEISTRFLESILERIPKEFRIPVERVEIYYVLEDPRYPGMSYLESLGTKDKILRIRIVGERTLNALRELAYTSVLHEYLHEVFKRKENLKKEIVEKYREKVLEEIGKVVPIETIKDRTEDLLEDFAVEFYTMKFIGKELAEKRRKYFERALESYNNPIVKAHFLVYLLAYQEAWRKV